MTEEQIILQEYKKAFKNYYDKKVVDLDERLDKNLDCFLARLETTLPELGNALGPNRQSRFIIIYVTKGSGEKTIGTHRFGVKDKTLMIVPSRTIHSAAYEEGTKGFYLSFNLHFFLQAGFPNQQLATRKLFDESIQPFVIVGSEQDKRLTNIFEVILKESAQDLKNREAIIALKILELMVLCDRYFSKQKKELSIGNPYIIQYLDLIDMHYKEEHSTSYYAARLNIHPNALNAAIKRGSGSSAKRVLETKLLNESKSLLRQTSLSIKEIAYQIGFNSPPVFFRFFKRHTGLSPEQYRSHPFDLVSN
jgi:AraC family transcriptional activator of pobA